MCQTSFVVQAFFVITVSALLVQYLLNIKEKMVLLKSFSKTAGRTQKP
jgi:hypothetical protein